MRVREPPLSFRGAEGEPGTHNHDGGERDATAVAPILNRQRLWVPDSRCARSGMTVGALRPSRTGGAR